MTACAVVVTYNRGELLTRCLDALAAQTRPVERVVVIDNASTDGTPELLRERGYLDRPEIDYVRLEVNSGGAGGFAEGVLRARELGSDWIWLMDDDAEPRPDSLAAMLDSEAARDERTAALCPKVVYADGELDTIMRGHFHRRLRHLAPSDYVPGRHTAIGFTSFVGPLVRAAVARAIEPPRADFFVWGDDVEYSLRLRRHGELRLVSESVIVHNAARPSYMNRRGRLWNRILPWRMFPTPLERFWQNLCGIRNYIWLKREYEGQSALSAAGTTLQFVVKALLYDDQPLRRVPWILRFARDGRRGRFVNIPPSRWVEMVRRGEV